ncbi:hypothetical protein NITHO_4990011 [Nitrolancea hollandica Lb]|uniref:Uncharacterized protein n=1 Tax=Nitrolancea hollandica Lb TaxID=1129897 RepID=I4EL84_9BACT|nr:hypothetical protein NITHO_4990011 [Nitrolancea hollandica Lb]
MTAPDDELRRLGSLVALIAEEGKRLPLFDLWIAEIGERGQEQPPIGEHHIRIGEVLRHEGILLGSVVGVRGNRSQSTVREIAPGMIKIVGRGAGVPGVRGGFGRRGDRQVCVAEQDRLSSDAADLLRGEDLGSVAEHRANIVLGDAVFVGHGLDRYAARQFADHHVDGDARPLDDRLAEAHRRVDHYAWSKFDDHSIPPDSDHSAFPRVIAIILTGQSMLGASPVPGRSPCNVSDGRFPSPDRHWSTADAARCSSQRATG